MTATQIIQVVNMLISGSQLASRAGLAKNHESGKWDVFATVYNADGIGKKDMTLASVDSVALAVEIARQINFMGALK